MLVSNWALHGFINLFVVLSETTRSIWKHKGMCFLLPELCNLEVRDYVRNLRKTVRTACWYSFGLMLQNHGGISSGRTSPGLKGLVCGGLGSGLTDVTRSSNRSKGSPSHAGDLCACLYQRQENHSSRKTNSGREDREMSQPWGAKGAGAGQGCCGAEGHLPRATGQVPEGESSLPAW